ncbi:MAG TPA: zf-HC2 domain-containing protein [Bacteroidota bacterium]|nr:zf-HC2 domain-containing protein [Bacteroidota bacterium]
MKCLDVYLHVCEDLDRKLGTRRCREIRKHLEGCPDCRAYLESLKSTVAVYQSLTPPRLSGAAHRRMLSALRSSGCLPPRRGRTGAQRRGR